MTNTTKKISVLVLCTGNSCRSQMAHGYFREFGKGIIEVESAGVQTHGVNPFAMGIMAEDGINLMNHTSNHVDEYKNRTFDYVITVCDHANEVCPYFPGKTKRIHQNFYDPTSATGNVKEIIAEFRTARNSIRAFVKEFIAKATK